MVEDSIYNVILSFFGAIIGGILTVLLGPWVAEKFKLREEYFVPFSKWCTEFYGDLWEFASRYVGQADKNYFSPSDFSDIQVILDYRSLHNALINTSTWIGKIRKEDKIAYEELKRLLETVDRFWHYLENKYPKQLPSVEGVKEFNSSLKKLSGKQRHEIAYEIRCHLDKNRREYDKNSLEKILRYFRRQVPSSFWAKLSIKLPNPWSRSMDEEF
jgi:hypothetical protein